MSEEIKNNAPEEDEIDLLALTKTIWESRKFIIKVVVVFVILGVTVALLTPKEYTASSTMVPQLAGSSNKMGGLSSLAAMAGFNLNMDNTSSDLSPFVYPQIVQSVPFQLELMNTTFTFSDVEQPVSLFDYYTEYSKPGFLAQVKKYTIGLPFVLLKAIKGEQKSASVNPMNSGTTIRLTQDQEKVRKIVAGNVNLETNDKDGYIVLRSTFQEAALAAQVGQKAQELLQASITEFKIEKAKAQLDFIEERYAEKKADFEKAQAALAEFRDRNKNVTSALARTQEERLQSDYQLAFDVYSQLAQQMEQAQIKVKEDTPVFAVIKPVTVPLEDNNSGAKTLMIWTFLGGVIAIAWIFGKQFLATLKERWKEEE
ncbi:Wzz/FepE/Etk N-terminal domain-containing protein [Draconibacterium sp. IB214405]|uniref:Wzz/FepE/Etk N-terminal domain-containing protein n=1 Tax=Draconibacterium sp. IB214405 TaxID=3097352 RepID=UPI002A103DF8|nr:Wzz/FepE/Etk N-terminal domain-containing protein [Draconibacterium sp. IB214405]MDX8339310.1 Wzz/FepE/Etk N-terminal domain-containing protein [Draconibacterium sp. IB214405]